MNNYPIASAHEAAILKTLFYYDIFSQPLTLEEIKVKSEFKLNGQTDQYLKSLLEKGFIKQKDKYYFLASQSDDIILKRETANENALRWIKKTKAHVWWFSLIPIIECVCISGSLSKYYMDKHSDIDYFIIVKANRLWIFKLLTSIVIKAFLKFGIKKYFCANYMITNDNLLIQKQNLYTATEIATLIPIYNKSIFDEFIRINSWYKNFLPNSDTFDYRFLIPNHESFVYKAKASLLAFKLFDQVDAYLYTFYQSWWKDKFKGAGKEELMINRKNIKMHTLSHGKRIMETFQQKIIDFEKEFSVSLTSLQAPVI